MQSTSKLQTGVRQVNEKKIKFACITPTLDVMSNSERFFEFLNSHKWRVLKSEPYGPDGFLSKLTCSNCNLSYDLALTNILESARNARSAEIRRIVNSKNVGNHNVPQEDDKVGSFESNEALWGLYLDKDGEFKS